MTPTASDTFLAGSVDGRIISYSTSTGEASRVDGEGHSSRITALASTSDGKTFSVGYDDKVREIDGTSFTSAPSFYDSQTLCSIFCKIYSSSSVSTSSQPTGVAVTEDSAVFVIQGETVQVFKSNQKVFEMKAYRMMAITTSKSVVAIGTLVYLTVTLSLRSIHGL